eukprot:6336302-Prorocentrum_lima.AAC.1
MRLRLPLYCLVMLERTVGARRAGPLHAIFTAAWTRLDRLEWGWDQCVYVWEAAREMFLGG